MQLTRNRDPLFALFVLLILALACALPAEENDPVNLTRDALIDKELASPGPSPTHTPVPPTEPPPPTVGPTISPTPAPTETPFPPTPTATPDTPLGGEPGVYGYTWIDSNQNGLRDGGEPPLSGVDVSLWSFGPSAFYDPETGTFVHLNDYTYVLQQTATGEDGRYVMAVDPALLDQELAMYVVFGRPTGYDFTLAHTIVDEGLDSDARPEDGATSLLTGAIASGAQVDAGYVDQTTGFVTPGEVITTTAIVSDTLPTFIFLPDEKGDAVICGTEEVVDDPEVDMGTIVATAAQDWYTIQVDMEAPLESDYSFALGQFLFDAQVPINLYLWEIHEGAYRIGATDVQTFDLLPEGEAPMEFLHDTDNGRLLAIIPREQVTGDLQFIAFRTFHSPAAGAPTRCDFAGPFALPDAWVDFPPIQNE